MKAPHFLAEKAVAGPGVLVWKSVKSQDGNHESGQVEEIVKE